MSRSLSWWATVLGIASLLAIVALSAVTYHNTQVSRESERTVAQSHVTHELLNRLLVTLQDAETGQRGYLLTGDERYLEPYVDSLQRTHQITEVLKGHFADHPESLQRLQRIEDLTEKKHAELSQTLALRKSSAPDAYEQAVQSMLTDRGRQLMVAIRQEFDAIAAAEDQRLDERLRHAERRAAVSKWSILVGTLLTLGLVSGTGGAMRADRRRRRAAEMRFETERKRLDAIVDASIAGITAIDAELRFVLVNPAAAKALGYDDEQLIGRSVFDVIPPDQRDEVQRIIAELIASDSQRYDFARSAYLRADGSRMWTEGSIVKVAVEGQALLTTMFRDLTTEDHHRAQVRKQEAVLDQIREAVYLRDEQGRITYWNQAAADLFGWSPEEAQGQMAVELLAHGRKPMHDEADRMLAETGVWRGEVKQFAKGDREIVVEKRRSALKDDEGRVIGQVVINTDVTELRKQEQVDRRNQRLESIGTLTGGIAHDLNNVLTPILMGARLLQREQPAENRRQLLETIRASAERGAEMIRQLLSFAGGGPAERQNVDVSRVVDEVVGMLRHTLPKSITIEVDCPLDLWSVAGDPTELSQVLMNLAVNARDAMPEGGSLQFTLANAQLASSRPTVAASLPPGPYVTLSISDTGHGIPPEIVERVFDPFFTTKAQGHGTGLGLATSLGIVRTHGGSMSVYSEPGQGTRFTIYVPATPTEAEVAAEASREAAAPSCGETVLVIDDEPLLVDMARFTLQGAGYHVLTAPGGAEGIALFQERRAEIAAILVDMMMPGIDGQATIDAVRAIDAAIPIVATSGLRRPDTGEQRIRDAQAFLAKPYTDEQLLGTIRQAIDQRRRIGHTDA